MATKKKGPFSESEKARRTARVAFVDKKVGEKGITRAQARQRYYVQTRIAEMKAKGKTVTPEMRKQLQQKFQSGDVSRRGFAAPKKKTGSSSSVTPKVTSRTDSSGRSGFGATAPRSMPSANEREGRGGFGATRPKAPTRNQIEGRGGPMYGKPASRTDSKGRSGFGATSSKRSGIAQANPRTAKFVGGVVGGLKSIGSAITPNRANPSRVSQSAAANRAAKAKADAAKKKKMNSK